jgi:hypothetical protein
MYEISSRENLKAGSCKGRRINGGQLGGKMSKDLLRSYTRVSENELQILDIPTLDKEIFTAKTDEGYVGCFRLDKGVFFTADCYTSALTAANAARKLKKDLVQEDKIKVTVKTKQTKTKKSSLKNRKSVKYPWRLFTSDEVDRMPLLKFREVWVIIKGDEFVSDALNQEKKKLVEFVPTRDNARFFTCHEEAKRIMRVLKSTVGPGFDLKRFFISNEDS